MTLKLATTLVFCVVMAAALQASVTVTGAVYTVTEAESQNAVLPLPMDAVLNNTFIVNATGLISFSESDNSIYTFLNSGGAIGITGPDGSMDPTLVVFVVPNFTLSNGAMFQVGHDDGASFYIGSTNFFSQPGPTSYVLSTFTYTGPTTTGTLNIVYGECCGTPGIFATNLPTGGNTPEPGTLIMFGSGVIGLAGLLRRKINL